MMDMAGLPPECTGEVIICAVPTPAVVCPQRAPLGKSFSKPGFTMRFWAPAVKTQIKNRQKKHRFILVHFQASFYSPFLAAIPQVSPSLYSSPSYSRFYRGNKAFFRRDSFSCYVKGRAVGPTEVRMMGRPKVILTPPSKLRVLRATNPWSWSMETTPSNSPLNARMKNRIGRKRARRVDAFLFRLELRQAMCRISSSPKSPFSPA